MSGVLPIVCLARHGERTRIASATRALSDDNLSMLSADENAKPTPTMERSECLPLDTGGPGLRAALGKATPEQPITA